LPEAPVQRLLQPLARFLEIESASGVVLLVCTLVALGLANSPWADAFGDFWHLTHVRVGIGHWELNESLLHWVNDGLMTIFFFVVGLEIKREIVAGELRDPRKAALPIAAALGGMIAPAAIYLALRGGQPGHQGWGIPMATDIAFVVGFLALLGPRVPLGLKILLLSLAIADDIGAVLVIAVFYSTKLSLAALGIAAAGLVLTTFLNRMGVRSVAVYVAAGAAVWLAFFKSGVHPTVAGVLLGLLTPVRAWVDEWTLSEIVGDITRWLSGEHQRDEQDRQGALGQLSVAAREAVSPLGRLETTLHPWVAFAIMPVFALANAGVRIEPSALGHPVALAVAAGLVIGKPLGIVLVSWLTVRLGIARLPTGVNWQVMLGAGCLAGIGFTMSLFIAGLALPPELLDAGKLGTLCGSAVSAVLGSVLLLMFLPKPAGRGAAADNEVGSAH
jgi:NhaA family Na+:H+ antiporter